MMTSLLLVHKITVLLSLFSFFIRGLGHILAKPWIEKKVVKIAPHIIDTILIVSAVALIVIGPWSGTEDWILAKIAGLVAYILLGILAFKKAKARNLKAFLWMLALLAFFYMVAVAKTHLAWPF